MHTKPLSTIIEKAINLKYFRPHVVSKLRRSRTKSLGFQCSFCFLLASVSSFSFFPTMAELHDLLLSLGGPTTHLAAAAISADLPLNVHQANLLQIIAMRSIQFAANYAIKMIILSLYVAGASIIPFNLPKLHRRLTHLSYGWLK